MLIRSSFVKKDISYLLTVISRKEFMFQSFYFTFCTRIRWFFGTFWHIFDLLRWYFRRILSFTRWIFTFLAHFALCFVFSFNFTETHAFHACLFIKLNTRLKLINVSVFATISKQTHATTKFLFIFMHLSWRPSKKWR